MKINVGYRQLRRLLHLLFILVVFIAIVYCVYESYWLVKKKLFSEHSHSNEEKRETLEHGNTQRPPTLESPIINVTPIPDINRDKIYRSRLPWYFKDGLSFPEKDLVDNKTGVRTLKLWPEEQPHGDRVVEQLMFVPPHYTYENSPMKRILIFNNLNSWRIEEGQDVFIWNECPVNTCTLTTIRSSINDMDAVLFRDKYENYELPWNAKNQIRIFYIQQSAYYAELDFDIQENFINWIASYRQDSDIVVPYGRWVYYGNSSVIQEKQLKRNHAQNKKQLVAAVFSECDADNGRMEYAGELSNYIKVDIYGQCGDHYAMESDSFYETLGQEYRFYLAFEDSNCINYITETFFDKGLGYGMLPIVMGGRREDYEQVAPEHSYLHVDDFKSPKELAQYLIRLSNDDVLYNEYFRWKGTGEFIDTKFFCRLCAMLHDESAPIKHYQSVSKWWRGPDTCEW